MSCFVHPDFPRTFPYFVPTRCQVGGGAGAGSSPITLLAPWWASSCCPAQLLSLPRLCELSPAIPWTLWQPDPRGRAQHHRGGLPRHPGQQGQIRAGSDALQHRELGLRGDHLWWGQPMLPEAVLLLGLSCWAEHHMFVWTHITPIHPCRTLNLSFQGNLVHLKDFPFLLMCRMQGTVGVCISHPRWHGVKGGTTPLDQGALERKDLQGRGGNWHTAWKRLLGKETFKHEITSSSSSVFCSALNLLARYQSTDPDVRYLERVVQHPLQCPPALKLCGWLGQPAGVEQTQNNGPQDCSREPLVV